MNKISSTEDKKQVCAFLGLTGYYRRFIPKYAETAAPPANLTRKDAPNRVKWNSECDKAFSKLKETLCSSIVLRSPDFNQPFILQTDASNRGVGAVLSQCDADGTERLGGVLQPEVTPPRRTLLHCRKRVSRHQTGYIWISCASPGQALHYPDRSPST